MISRAARECLQLECCPSSACRIPESVEAQRQVVPGCEDRTKGLVQMGEGGVSGKGPEAAPERDYSEGPGEVPFLDYELQPWFFCLEDLQLRKMA